MASQIRLLIWLARSAFVLCFVVVVLGAYVRLSAAGLGCPDWPGCYGHATPSAAIANASEATAAFGGQEIVLGKAWREMIHRYAAATLGFFILSITALAIQNRQQRWAPWRLALSLLVLVVAQGVLGMLTVTWQLKPLIVTAHLLFGLATLSLLWWLVLSLPRPSPSGIFLTEEAVAVRSFGSPISRARHAAALALVALLFQIALGGWTSSNYAATACPDFPRCQNSWLPDAQYRDAFVLWRGLGINYEGGVLDHPARVAIHFTHRLGAIVASVALLIAGVTVWRRVRAARNAVLWVCAALAMQLTIGATMVLKGFPLWLATLHNAGAAWLLLCVVTLLHRLRSPPVH
jgi:cytochrome c oxidase assembly protein subunit 15